MELTLFHLKKAAWHLPDSFCCSEQYFISEIENRQPYVLAQSPAKEAVLLYISPCTSCSARQKHSPFALQEDLEALPLQLQFPHSDRNIHQKQNQAAFSYMDVLLLQQASHSPEFPQFFPDT